MTPAAALLALPVRAYRLVLSPWVGHGCRFQPRCPVVASGRAAELRIEDRCRADDLALMDVGEAHHAACHLVPLGEQP